MIKAERVSQYGGFLKYCEMKRMSTKSAYLVNYSSSLLKQFKNIYFKRKLLGFLQGKILMSAVN